ncbi:MAG: SsrA-binding protein SmpB [Candidatus Tritonobacter lacicola]|nr:SsrA-binding protein SmpB [Candidatus Tritonobacter lacicola]
MCPATGDAGRKVIVANRRARWEYHIFETYEAGIELVGSEVKSLRQGKGNLRDSYGVVESGEVFLHNMHISPYEQGGVFNLDPYRKRKLLLHKREIKRLFGLISRKGYTLVPLSMYFKRGRAKVEMAVARGKKLYDRRDNIQKREMERDIERALRNK